MNNCVCVWSSEIRLEVASLSPSLLEKDKRECVAPSIRLMVRLYLSRKLQNEMVITLSLVGYDFALVDFLNGSIQLIQSKEEINHGAHNRLRSFSTAFHNQSIVGRKNSLAQGNPGKPIQIAHATIVWKKKQNRRSRQFFFSHRVWYKYPTIPETRICMSQSILNNTSEGKKNHFGQKS